jgi:D-serine deaminase-like pyridoxal phosphate-dependent protein
MTASFSSILSHLFTQAGEIAEHFREYVLISGGAIVSRVPTYRGMGQAFY